ncbi:ferritin family protein [Desulfobacula sp.]|uniref:ferritin family protein n=1 Tax=Desulfobacula sp. TaxID=2593537 RepID=UPI0026373761|nr:ferritin family protein [Desulfobacula sp.]
MISRRQLLYYSALMSLGSLVKPLNGFVTADKRKTASQFPLTLAILKTAYGSELTAAHHYNGYCQKALAQTYPNIAYLFSALSVSEKIHADNFHTLILSLGSAVEAENSPVSISDTKANLNMAATKELEKITKFYPDILKDLSSESHDQAVINCMYSWKSHQQHKQMILDIKKYSGIFFNPLAKKIESMNPEYYVCNICGATRDEEPKNPCDICNRPLYHYQKLERPRML